MTFCDDGGGGMNTVIYWTKGEVELRARMRTTLSSFSLLISVVFFIIVARNFKNVNGTIVFLFKYST